MNERLIKLDKLKIVKDPPPPSGARRPLRSYSIVAIALLATIAAAYLYMVQETTTAVPVRVYRVSPSERGVSQSLSTDVTGTGYIEAHRRAMVSTTVTGKATVVPVQEGDYVEANQVIARLDDTEARAELRVAQSQVQVAEAELKVSEIALLDATPIFDRKQSLLATKVISAETFDDAKATFNTAKGNAEVRRQNLDESRATLEKVRRDLSDTIIRAPFSGVVTTVNIQPGELLSPQSGGISSKTSVATIVDMQSLEAVIDINETFLSRLAPGRPAVITLNAYPDWKIDGDVIAISPTADRAKGTIEVRIKPRSYDKRILPEMGVTVAFLKAGGRSQSSSGDNSIAIPNDTIETVGTERYVYVVANNTVKRVEVSVSTRTQSDGMVLVTGLVGGEEIAIPLSNGLKDGNRVLVAN